MADYVTLLGAEQMQSAANRIASAADQFSRAVSNMDDSLERHRRWQDEWLDRLQSMLEAHEKGMGVVMGPLA
jgi:hypothetical protein